jgi:glycosyltransferase involved in cell wall biosynthesis
MNILFVYYVPSGGVDTLNRQRTKALKNLGITSHCLYYIAGSGLQNAYSTPTFIAHSDAEIKRIVDRGNYHAIVVISDDQFFPRIRRLGYKGILIWEIQGLGDMKYAEAQIIHAKSNVIGYADAILYPYTPHIISYCNKHYPSFKKFCFPNCIDTEIFSYRALPKSPHPIIGWIGRIEDNKNWIDFLRIGKSLLSYNPSIQLWMFEDASLSAPEQRVKFQQVIRDLKLENNLTIRSNIPHSEMPDYFSKIGDSGGFLCSTSKTEGAPYAILEAMSCRCPILTTNSDGVQGYVFHNKTGKYYSHGDIAEAVQEARELMENKNLRNGIWVNALNYVKSNFTLSQYTSNFLNMLRELERQRGG